jgi:protein deglycase
VKGSNEKGKEFIENKSKLKRGYYFIYPDGHFCTIALGVLIIYTGILLYPRFSEYELSVLLSVLKQGQKPTVYIGLNDQVVKGEAGLPSIPEVTVNEVDINQLDSIVLPGVDGFEHLVDHPDLTKFLRKFQKKNIVIGAISSAPYLLSMSGLLDERKYTTGLTADQRKFLGTFNEDNYLDSPVVIDGNLITAKGPAFVDFAIKYGELLNLNFDKSWYTIK